MSVRLENELANIRTQYGEVKSDPTHTWIVITDWSLPPGWGKRSTNVLVLIPNGYPVTPPDNFYTDNDLRLSDGQLPGSTTPNQLHLGRQWLQFSYHVEATDWQPHKDESSGHNLLTFLTGVSARLMEIN